MKKTHAHQQPRHRLVAAALLAAACTVAPLTLTATPAVAQSPTDPIHFWTLPFASDSGNLVGVGNGLKAIHSATVQAPGAPWIRVAFDRSVSRLDGPTRGDGATYLRITSLEDGYHQILNADTLDQWGYSSAYFNGDTVVVEVFAAEGSSARISVEEIQAGLVPDGEVASICGPTDDRIASTDPRVARLMPVGCTSWLFDGKPNAMLTAGHCFNGTTATVVQFNVPLSAANGAPQNPPPQDQYAVDPASVVWQETAIGNDWAHFGVFSNSTTGLAPLVAQGASVGRTAPVAGGTIRITGFGVDNGTANQTNQTNAGPFDSLAGTIIRYQADTTGGNSGSPIIRESTGQSMGIHTHAGCFDNGGGVGGANQGTTFGNAALIAAINNPQGVSAATTACGLPGTASCFVAHPTPHCNDAECCSTVCAADPFCCNTSWDQICVNRAWETCANCGGDNTAPCDQSHTGTGCASGACCQLICTQDPFCCETAWDSLCASRARSLCRTGANCAEPRVLSTAFPGSFNFNTADDATPSDESICGVNDTRAVWLQYTAACTGGITAEICTEFGESQPTLSIFTACGGTQLACSSSAASGCSLGDSVRLEFFGTQGTNYLIRVSAIDNLLVAGSVSVTCEATCGTGESCYTAHAAPGCNDGECCETVCTADPFCCTTQWDSLCVNRAWDLCQSCGSGKDSCFSSHASPGCNTVSCCASVCAVDPFCCETSWDSLCVLRAETICRAGTTCSDARLWNTTIPGGDQFNTGLAFAGTDDSSCGTGDTRAIWFRYVATCSGMTELSSCTEFAESQMTLAVFSECGGSQLACSATGTDCAAFPHEVEVRFATTAGETYLVRVSAINGLAAAGGLSASCDAVCGVGEDCDVPHSTPGCADESCCVTVCTVDPFCCNNQWDSLCVNGANALCTSPIQGDLNGDGAVNASDLSILLNNWGGAGVSDINGDGTTNAADLSILLNNWS